MILGGSVGIATGYGLGGPSNRDEGEVFRTRPDRSWSPTNILYNGYLVSCPVLKRPGCGVDHPPFNAEVKQTVDIYFYPHPLLGLHGLFSGDLYLYHVTYELIHYSQQRLCHTVAETST